MIYSVLDIETDGLFHEEGIGGITATKIHCICVSRFEDGQRIDYEFTDYDKMREYLVNNGEGALVGHNIIRFDKPILEKFLGIKIQARLIDTLGLSWYLYPRRLKHGLAEWGEHLGIEKPVVTDWKWGSVEMYIHRCSEDVKINTRLWELQSEYLFRIYDGSHDAVLRLISYIKFKMECAAEQEEMKWKLDEVKCRENLAMLMIEKQKKTEILAEIMPTVTKFKYIARPKAIHTKKGELSIAGAKWLELLREKELPEYHVGTIEVPISTERGNPRSYQQMKKWLFNMGWEPDLYNYIKLPDGKFRKVPQISTKEGEICDSVKLIYEDVPRLEALEGFFIVNHRISILEGFLENRDSNNYLMAQIKGLTNTLRFQHTGIVNLPTIPKAYWKEIRECLIADEDMLLCGADMSGLEDNTKQHYMYYYDPEYVKELRTPDFDPHLDIAVLAGLLTPEQANEHRLYTKSQGKEGVSHKAIRLKSKKVNFAATYGAGPNKLALTANIPISEAKLLYTTYWRRNKAIKDVVANVIVKYLDNQAWLYNPISKFWNSLRAEKDKFSTLNQGTGVYCFDTWIRYVRGFGIKLKGQFHDEIVIQINDEEKSSTIGYLNAAIEKTNHEINLNVPLAISMDFGKNYAEVH